MDLLRQLGSLALASRLRRLAEWLYKDGAKIYQLQTIDFEPRWFPLFYLLKELGKLSVSQAAQSLGYTHPAINQIACELSKRGFIESVKDKKDKRKRILQLTIKGREALPFLEPVWTDIESTVREMLEKAGGDFLASLGKLEDELNKRGVYERVALRIKKRQLKDVEVFDYQSKYKKYFKTLNYEWLKEFFTVEEEDEQLLSDPYVKIIKPGGFVFFAQLDGKIIGTAALIKHNEHTYELTKMAVTRKARGKEAGRALALAAIQKAKEDGAEKIVLLTSPRLTAAYNLYRSLGFVETTDQQTWATAYLRGGIPMSLDLKKKKP